VDVTVHFFHPADAAEDWIHGISHDLAVAIPGISVVADPDGATAEKFGSKTSGEVLLYDATGRLRFHGGITAARGHEGDGLGKATVTSILRGESTTVTSSPVFGCVIRSSIVNHTDAE
jgi:hypothetical protein